MGGLPRSIYNGDAPAALKPDLAGMPSWIVARDPKSWMATTFVWHGPWQQQHGVQPAVGKELGGLLAVPRAQPQPLIKEAAAIAFWDLGSQPLQWILKQYHLIAEHDTLYSVLHTLVAHFLPQHSETQLLDVLALRMARPEQYAELLDVDTVDEAVHGSDAREWAEEQEAKKKSEQHTCYQKEWRAKRVVAARAASANVAPLQFGPGPSSSAGSAGGQGSTYTRLPDHRLSTAEAERFLPPGWHIHLDGKNRRWQIWGQGLNISRSWLLYGFEASCKLCIRLAWEHSC